MCMYQNDTDSDNTKIAVRSFVIQLPLLLHDNFGVIGLIHFFIHSLFEIRKKLKQTLMRLFAHKKRKLPVKEVPLNSNCQVTKIVSNIFEEKHKFLLLLQSN